MNNKHIPWFNPREMTDDTIISLNTGRTILLNELLSNIEQRLITTGLCQNWLITGSRGAGKSFFLRLLQARLTQELKQTARFVLLPEELPNIYAPHELLLEIQRLLNPNQNLLGTAARWRVEDEAGLAGGAEKTIEHDQRTITDSRHRKF